MKMNISRMSALLSLLGGALVLFTGEGFAGDVRADRTTPRTGPAPGIRLTGRLITKLDEFPYVYVDKPPFYSHGELRIEDLPDGKRRVRWRSCPLSGINVGQGFTFTPKSDWFVYAAPYESGFVVICGASLREGMLTFALFSGRDLPFRTADKSVAEKLRAAWLPHAAQDGIAEGVVVTVPGEYFQKCKKVIR